MRWRIGCRPSGSTTWAGVPPPASVARKLRSARCCSCCALSAARRRCSPLHVPPCACLPCLLPLLCLMMPGLLSVYAYLGTAVQRVILLVLPGGLFLAPCVRCEVVVLLQCRLLHLLRMLGLGRETPARRTVGAPSNVSPGPARAVGWASPRARTTGARSGCLQPSARVLPFCCTPLSLQ